MSTSTNESTHNATTSKGRKIAAKMRALYADPVKAAERSIQGAERLRREAERLEGNAQHWLTVAKTRQEKGSRERNPVKVQAGKTSSSGMRGVSAIYTRLSRLEANLQCLATDLGVAL